MVDYQAKLANIDKIDVISLFNFLNLWISYEKQLG